MKRKKKRKKYEKIRRIWHRVTEEIEREREREGGMRVCGREREVKRGGDRKGKKRENVAVNWHKFFFVIKRNRKCAKHGGVS